MHIIAYVYNDGWSTDQSTASFVESTGAAEVEKTKKRLEGGGERGLVGCDCGSAKPIGK